MPVEFSLSGYWGRNQGENPEKHGPCFLLRCHGISHMINAQRATVPLEFSAETPESGDRL
jgi:hypothetical protein